MPEEEFLEQFLNANPEMETGFVIKFDQLDKSTIFEKADSRANQDSGQKKYFIRKSPQTASPVNKNPNGSYTILPEEIPFMEESAVRVVAKLPN